MKCVTVVVWLAVLVITVTNAVLPGMRISFSSIGINYAIKMTLDQVSREIRGQKITDQTGSSHIAGGKVKYQLTNMHVTSFTEPRSSVRPVPPDHMNWVMSGGVLGAHGDWRYHYKKGFIRVKDHGSFDLKVYDIGIATSLQFDMDARDAPTIILASCSSNIGKVKVKFHGGASWLYNLFDHKIASAIRHNLESTMCINVRKAIERMAKHLHDMKLEVPFAKIFLLDYRFVKAPAISPKYLEAYFKGEVFMKGNRSEAPFQPEPLAEPLVSTKMIEYAISDYVMNTLLYSVYKQGLLNYDFTVSDLPSSLTGLLNTTCRSDVHLCIGNLIPQLALHYAHTQVGIEMKALKSPRIDLQNGRMQISLLARCALYIKLPSGSKVHLFYTILNATVSITGTLDDSLLEGKVDIFSASVKLVHSSIGPIKTTALKQVADLIGKGFFVPRLNGAGKQGMPLPHIKDIKFVNGEFVIAKGFLHLMFDVVYKPTTLYFQPSKLD